MEKKQSSKFKKIITIIVTILVLSLIIPLPVPVSRTMEGMAWEIGNDGYKEVQKVEIKGIYYCYLLRNNVFKGSVGFNKAPESRGYQVSFTSKKPWNNSEDIVGAAYMDQIDFTGLFSKVLIHVTPEHGGVYISAPAAERDEAIKVANEVYGHDVFE
ncbi:MAG: hypothetical protein IJ315_05935 [Firmicutes bacterium]|nr:hypothetical protein [Bacillota bacterium]